MKKSIQNASVFKASDDVVSKTIEGTTMLVPIIAGVGNLDAEIFQLNETGSRIWEMMDGKTSLETIVACLCNEYDASAQAIQEDVVELVGVLLEKQFISRIV